MSSLTLFTAGRLARLSKRAARSEVMLFRAGLSLPALNPSVLRTKKNLGIPEPYRSSLADVKAEHVSSFAPALLHYHLLREIAGTFLVSQLIANH